MGGFFQHTPDHLKDRLGLREHFIVPEPQNSKAALLQKTRATRIVGNCSLMLATIEFDHQHGIQTDEIDDERPDGKLSTESRTVKMTTAQVMPEATFCIGGRAP